VLIALASPILLRFPLLGPWLAELRNDGNARKAQHAATEIVEDVVAREQLNAAASPQDKARLMSCRTPGAMMALTPAPFNTQLLPIKVPPLMEDDEFGAALGLYLGRSVAGPQHVNCCFCKLPPSPLQTLDEHIRRCAKGGGKQRLHSLLKEGWMSILAAAGMAPRSEWMPFPGLNLRLDIVASVRRNAH
jgi:hypothetical protein